MKRTSFTDMTADEHSVLTESLMPKERVYATTRFANARLRGVTRHPHTGRPIIGFDTDSGPVRFHLSWDDANNIILGGNEFWFNHNLINRHSLSSSGNAQSSGLPQDGQNVDPLTKSSNACSGVEYDPSASSSKNGAHIPLWTRIVNTPRRLSNSQYPFMNVSIGSLASLMVTATGRAFKSAQFVRRSLSFLQIDRGCR